MWFGRWGVSKGVDELRLNGGWLSDGVDLYVRVNT